jgi:multiple sugar transport system substrate-binding protein
MLDTLNRLQACGIEYPLAMSTGGLSLHNLACFVWGRGGGFRSTDYRRITLTEPEARRGMADYYKLHRFIPPEGRRLDYAGADNHFFEGRAAVLLSGQWVTVTVKEQKDRANPIVAQNYACTLPPGIPYVGGTHLVIWKHSLHDQDALRLINHLTSPELLTNLFRITGNIPARIAALNTAPFTNDPDYQRVIDCIRTGRGFRSTHLWAGVEMRLSVLCDQLWSDLFANPDILLDMEIEHRLRELATRLEKTLLASW